MIKTALRYLRAGLCVLPAVRAEKRPAVPRWKEFQKALPNEAQLAAWCRRADALCLVCGAVSGNLEMLDFDLSGEAFDAWYAKVRERDATLPDRLVIEQSPSGGWHVVYRCQEPVCGNQKLAQRIERANGPAEVTIAGKTEDVDRLLDGHPIHLVNTDPPYNVRVEPRSNNAIAAGLSSYPSAEELQGGRKRRGHHQAMDVARHPEKAQATHRKLRADHPSGGAQRPLPSPEPSPTGRGQGEGSP